MTRRAAGKRAYYLCVNRNKRGMVVNLKTDEGKVFLRNLAMQSDVLMEMQHPTIGVLSLVGSPLKMGVTPVQYHLPLPLMGQHTQDILTNILGFSMKRWLS